MQPTVYKTHRSATEIMRQLDQCRKHLKTGNLFSCISIFHDTLDAFIRAKGIIEADRLKVITALNDFQQQLAASRQFQDLYGAFAFRANDFKTSFDFIAQLITVREEDIADFLLNNEVASILSPDKLSRDDRDTAKMMISLVERGEQLTLREMVAENDDLASLILNYYNDTGINYRISGDMDKAITSYRKALSVSPNDEHLYYNIARAYIEKGNKNDAEECIGQALVVNPEFREGLKLQQYIKKWDLLSKF